MMNNNESDRNWQRGAENLPDTDRVKNAICSIGSAGGSMYAG